MYKVNIKTLQRFFSVLGVLCSVFILLFVVTPLTFAAVPVDSSVYSLPVDRAFPTLYSYFFGNNTGIIDFKYNNQWTRVVLNNNFARAAIDTETISNRTHYILKFNHINNASGSVWYFTNIGSSYSSNMSWTSSTWYDTLSASYDLGWDNPYINSCGVPIQTSVSSSVLNHCDFNSYYPLVTVSGGGSVTVDLSPVLDNQATIISRLNDQSAADNYYHEVDQSERRSIAASQEAADNSRQSEIMSAGSDVTVSTIDNWVDGEGGLAQKLTQLAATLSSNAAVFSENQVSNQENLSKAGAFVNGVFNEFPVGVIAALICFLIMVIAVKVVGR